MKATVQTNFRNEHKTKYLAQNIAQFNNHGSAISDKIETVLNEIRETTGVQSLKTIQQEYIQAYVNSLIERMENGELAAKTVAGYISATNDVIKYANEQLNRGLDTVSASANSITVSREFNDRAVNTEVHQTFISYLEQKTDNIKAETLKYSVELQRQFGLRLRESLGIKADTIKQALSTNKLELGRADLTKNSRERTVPVRTKKQMQTLKNTLDFMEKHNLKSLIPTQTMREQYYFAENVRQEFNQNTNMKMDFHGERYYYAQNRFNNDKITREELSRELGHNREEITNVYLNK